MSRSPASQLWQVPLLLVSLGLFGYAAYLLYDPKPGPTVEQRLADARTLLKSERPEAAVERLKAIMSLDKLTAPQQGRVHLMFTEALELYQDQNQTVIPALQNRIIEQTKLAVARGVTLEGTDYRRLGKAFELLGRKPEALDNYKQAAARDPDRALRLSRKIVDLLLDNADFAAADAGLAEYLKDSKLTDAERCWALGMRGQLLSDQGNFAEARVVLDQALKLTADGLQEGEINYRLGYSSYKLGDNDAAINYLRAARDQLQIRHPLDADACLLLGNLYRGKNEPALANTFYDTVLLSHPDSAAVFPSKLGRALCRVLLREDEAAMADLVDLTKRIDERSSYAKFRPELLAGVQQAGRLMTGRGFFDHAIELMACEQTLQPEPAPEFFARLGNLYEKSAQQTEESIAAAAPAGKSKLQKAARDLFAKAGDSFLAYSTKLAGSKDKQYGDSLWHAIDLYERAAAPQSAVSALELFVAERPQDPLTPDAMLRLGKAHQSIGQFDKAVAVLQKNVSLYPRSLAASKSAVPLAQAYIARGPDFYRRAEDVLVGVIDNNPLLDPTSEDFKQALFELGQLNYRSDRFEDALLRLEEYSKRYPRDDRTGQLYFLMADSYRKSAMALAERLAAGPSTQPSADPKELDAARRDRLQRAKILFDRMIELYREGSPAKEPEKTYFKLAHFYRADCLFDLGDYEAAIALYDAAAFRYQDDPSALAAYVQIVNAWQKLGKVEQAKAANERAKWVLRRMPAEAFKDGSFSMPKEYWEQWLKWTNESGLW